MDLKIMVKSWSVVTKDDKSKTIGGTYSVMCGPNEVATSEFNKGYGGTDIPVPSDLLSEIEAMDERVKTAIINNFTG